ncbi:MAG: DUF3369 domain-containing protein [Leptospiraceae bacterium]|nr:DUF3369 domain-containing protein [Leptospiraceae bacterium]MCB1305302.1 DUF3369 domain-containing protein [Leptospiraceae bacterium]
MSPNTETPLPRWRILAVDDDSLYQKTTEFGLRNFQVLGRPIELLQAGSFGAASAILSRERDIAVVLLDVVMDTEDAGFRLVKAIREVLGNAAIRIVMVTGQPGQSSMQASLKDYDINDYWNKTELTVERLKAVITANIRSYDQLTTVQRARQGLQMIAESSSALGESRTAHEFASRMIVEIAGVLGVPPEGIVCAGASDGPDQEPVILAAAGSHSRLSGKSISNIEDQSIRQELSRCLSKKETINAANHTVLYFDESLAGSAYAAYIATGRHPDQTETELLRVFTQNLGKGLHNVSLFSQLDRMAYEDSLVKLPNANALLRALSARGHDDRVLMLVDVDKFGEINLTLGTDVGDELLVKLGQALRQATDSSVMVARISDDLFALLGSSQYIDPQAVEFTTANSAREAGLGPISVSTVLY